MKAIIEDVIENSNGLWTVCICTEVGQLWLLMTKCQLLELGIDVDEKELN